MKRHLNPEGLPANPAFSQVVVVEQPTATIYVGGQNAVGPDGHIVGDNLYEQSAQALHNLRTALAAAGASLADVVRWTIAVVDGHPIADGFRAFQDLDDAPEPPPRSACSWSPDSRTRTSWSRSTPWRSGRQRLPIWSPLIFLVDGGGHDRLRVVSDPCRGARACAPRVMPLLSGCAARRAAEGRASRFSRAALVSALPHVAQVAHQEGRMLCRLAAEGFARSIVMKTSQTREVRKVDDRTSVEARSRSRVSAAPSRTGRVVRRTVIAVLVLLLIAVVAVAVVYTASDTAIQQPALEESQLFDRSVRARDGVAADGQRDTLFDRSVRARER